MDPNGDGAGDGFRGGYRYAQQIDVEGDYEDYQAPGNYDGTQAGSENATYGTSDGFSQLDWQNNAGYGVDQQQSWPTNQGNFQTTQQFGSPVSASTEAHTQRTMQGGDQLSPTTTDSNVFATAPTFETPVGAEDYQPLPSSPEVEPYESRSFTSSQEQGIYVRCWHCEARCHEENADTWVSHILVHWGQYDPESVCCCSCEREYRLRNKPDWQIIARDCFRHSVNCQNWPRVGQASESRNNHNHGSG